MKTIKLEIEDSAVDKVIWFLEQLKGVVKIETSQTNQHSNEIDLQNDPMAQELQRRIEEIDNGTMELIPHTEVMSRVYEKWEKKYM